MKTTELIPDLNKVLNLKNKNRSCPRTGKIIPKFFPNEELFIKSFSFNYSWKINKENSIKQSSHDKEPVSLNNWMPIAYPEIKEIFNIFVDEKGYDYKIGNNLNKKFKTNNLPIYICILENSIHKIIHSVKYIYKYKYYNISTTPIYTLLGDYSYVSFYVSSYKGIESLYGRKFDICFYPKNLDLKFVDKLFSCLFY